MSEKIERVWAILLPDRDGKGGHQHPAYWLTSDGGATYWREGGDGTKVEGARVKVLK